MATVLYLKDTKFNNPQLPKVHPFTINGFIADGLVMAFMPQNSPASLTDLSGNGVVLTQIGNPTWYPTGVKGWYNAGFRSSVPETIDFTLMCVARRHPGTDYNNANGPYNGSNLNLNSYIGNYTGTPKQDPNGANMLAAGTSLYNSKQTVTEDSTYYDKLHFPQCRGISPAGDQESTSNSGHTLSRTPDVTGPVGVSPWHFHIGGVDSVNAQIVGAGAERSSGFYSTRVANATTYPTWIGPNTYTTRPMYGQCWNLFCSDKLDGGDGAWTSTGISEVSAFAVWNRCLSLNEMQAQYEIMSALLKEQRGIIV